MKIKTKRTTVAGVVISLVLELLWSPATVMADTFTSEQEGIPQNIPVTATVESSYRVIMPAAIIMMNESGCMDTLGNMNGKSSLACYSNSVLVENFNLPKDKILKFDIGNDYELFSEKMIHASFTPADGFYPTYHIPNMLTGQSDSSNKISVDLGLSNGIDYINAQGAIVDYGDGNTDSGIDFAALSKAPCGKNGLSYEIVGDEYILNQTFERFYNCVDFPIKFGSYGQTAKLGYTAGHEEDKFLTDFDICEDSITFLGNIGNGEVLYRGDLENEITNISSTDMNTVEIDFYLKAVFDDSVLEQSTFTWDTTEGSPTYGEIIEIDPNRYTYQNGSFPADVYEGTLQFEWTVEDNPYWVLDHPAGP